MINQTSLNKTSESLYDGFLNTSDFRHVAVVETLAVLGFLIMITGYRYLRFAMFMCGFWLVFCLFYVFSPIVIHGVYCCNEEKYRTIHIGASLAVGLVAGIMTAGLYRVGVFLIGKCLGILLGILLIQTLLMQYFPSHVMISAFVAISAVLFGSLTWRCEKPLLILSTSSVGAFLVICGIDIFTRSNFSLLVISLLVYVRDCFLATYNNKSNLQLAQLPYFHALEYLSERSVDYVVGWFVLSLVSATFQYSVTAKGAREGGSICPVKMKTLLKCFSPCCFNCSSKNDLENKLSDIK